MNDYDLIATAVRQANPWPDTAARADGEWSTTELLSQIEHRSGTVDTIERTRTTEPSGPKRTRGWLLAAAMAALVVLIGAVVIGLTRDSGTDVVEPTPTTLSAPTTVPPTTVPTTTPAQPPIDRTPLEVMALYDEAYAAGDWTAMRALYADGAELEVVSPTETFVERTQLAGYEPRTPYDWDGDGLVDGFDGLIDDAARVYAHSATAFVSCSEVDAATVACEEVWEGHAFANPDRNPNTWTLIFADGYITAHLLQVMPQPAPPIDADLVTEYRQWVADNRADVVTGLFEDGTTLAISPDSVVVHRQLVPEWQAQAVTAEPPQALEASVTWDGETCTYDGPATIASGDQVTVTYSNTSTADAVVYFEVGLLEPGSTLADYGAYYDPAPAEYGIPEFVTRIDTFPTGLDAANNGLAAQDRLGIGESGDKTLGSLIPLEAGLYGFVCGKDIPPDWTVAVAQTGMEVAG